MNELVSIIIPAYNSAAHIAETLDSCLAQTYSPIEIIVVDDGSTDDTLAIVENYQTVRVIQQENSGPAIARNTGILAAKGKYIKFCDSDDILYPAHIEKCMNVFADAPANLAAVYTRYQHVLADGKTPKPDFKDPDLLSGDIFCDLLLSNANALLTSALTIKRDALIAVGMFPDDKDLRHAEDWLAFLRLAAEYHCASVPEILLNYRWHEENISRDKYGEARGKLTVWQAVYQIPRWRDCLTETEYRELEAGRYHVVAVAAWKKGLNSEARDAFYHALRLSKRSRTLRFLYMLLTYFAPFSIVRRINRLLER